MISALKTSLMAVSACAAWLCAWPAALAQSQHADGRHGKLLLTGGVSSVDGAAGGGLTPWALTGTYATEGQWGLSAFVTRLRTQDYGFWGGGLTLSGDDRWEISLAHQDFDTGATGAALGLPGLHLKQDVLSGKWRLVGEALLDSDSLWPQLAVGMQLRRLDAGGLAPTLAALGARTRDAEFTLGATKLLLGPRVLVNGTLRWTRANQNGLLGFGSSNSPARSLQPEVSVAWLLRRDLAVGAEYRRMPDKLNPSALGDGLAADDWKDFFVAWAPTKTASLTVAWADLGRVVPAVTPRPQRGLYLSVQVTP
ncbi:DUF3034 family protein [Ideonella sp.]|uniref:DUF3034 family protein n=1 Tax=Ideonella sp. TaxID=1929293 RepID=UPI0037BEF6D0